MSSWFSQEDSITFDVTFNYCLVPCLFLSFIVISDSSSYELFDSDQSCKKSKTINYISCTYVKAQHSFFSGKLFSVPSLGRIL